MSRSRRWRRILSTCDATALVAALAVGGVLVPGGAVRAQTGTEALAPDTVFPSSDRPRLVVLGAAGSPVVSLRASAPVAEGPAEAGAARMMVDLAVDRARAFAGPVSARIEGGRTPSGVAYTVTGASSDFDYLAYLLRLLVSEPQPNRIDFQRARSRLLDEARRVGETPAGRVVRQLRERAFPGVPPLEGDVGSLEGVTPETLRRVWARSHGRAALTVVVAGDLPPELLLASLQSLGSPGDAAEPPPSGSAPGSPTADAQILRRWYGEARVLPDARDPRGEVAAILVSLHMREVTEDFESHVELWEVGRTRALAVYGASYRAGQARMRSRIGAALGGTASDLTDAAVEAAVARVRRELLFEARTPWGRAAVVGRHLAAAGDPGAAGAYLEALDRITTASMRAYLEGLSALTPLRAEVTP